MSPFNYLSILMLLVITSVSAFSMEEKIPYDYVAETEKIIKSFRLYGPFSVYRNTLESYKKYFQERTIPADILELFFQDEKILSAINMNLFSPLRLYLDDYLNRKNPDTLIKIKESLEDLRKKYNAKKEAGTHMFNYITMNLLSADIRYMVRTAHNSGDNQLIEIFSKYLPLPRAHCFAEEKALPPHIEERENLAVASVGEFLDRNQKIPSAMLNRTILKIQRAFRGRLRQREELNRIHNILLRDNPKISIEETKAQIESWRVIYEPKCDHALLDRIKAIIPTIKLYEDFTHVTVPAAITNIFNDSLMGQRNLIYNLVNFSAAALRENDINEGDGAVVCCGPNQIDPKCNKESNVKIVFDLNKFKRDQFAINNPTMFYKQLDLCYVFQDSLFCSVPGRYGFNNINFGRATVSFNHKHGRRDYMSGNIKISAIMNEPGVYKDLSETAVGIHAASNIFYNIKNIDQVLIMNAFRYIDSLISGNNNKEIAPVIYENLARLDDDELKAKLTELGQKMSDTAEINFYGAWQIPFHLIKKLAVRRNIKTTTIELDDLIKDISNNNVAYLHKAQELLPEAFASYRFIDYLYEYTTQEGVARETLQGMYESCVKPAWVKQELR